MTSACGDGYVDALTQEACDDANEVAGDGCETSCERSCLPDADTCDDGNPCNGVESCGAEFFCEATEPPDCDDDNPCTSDTCDPGLLCRHLVIDGDGDGYAETSLGACGTDCNDDDPAVHPGASDPCDGVDNDCDDLFDEGGAVGWWQDCDKDGFATKSAASTQSCSKPTSATACAGGSWTAIDPNDIKGNSFDCNDGNAAIKPGAIELVGDEVDQDCNGGETCYADSDNDNYRVSTLKVSNDPDCTDSGEADKDAALDCNDNDSSVRPGVAEKPGDQKDQNCNGDEDCYVDADNDNYRLATIVESNNDLDCTDSGEARSIDTFGDCNDENPHAYGTEPPTASDAHESNPQWWSSQAAQGTGPTLPSVVTDDSNVLTPSGVLTFHDDDSIDHYMWSRAYASWNPFYQPYWMCRVTGLTAGQTVSMRVGLFRPAGGQWDADLCASPANTACFSHTGLCPSVANNGICRTSQLTNPSAGAATYGFGVSVADFIGWTTCDADYKVECKLTRDDDSW